MNKKERMKAITLEAWKALGTSRRGLIAEEYARILVTSHLNDDVKVTMLAMLPRIGWALNELAAEGYGYNSSSEAHYDRDKAGKLSVNNKKSVWVLKEAA